MISACWFINFETFNCSFFVVAGAANFLIHKQICNDEWDMKNSETSLSYNNLQKYYFLVHVRP